jgi:hypothetical protein
MPNHYIGDLLHTIGISGPLPRANRAFAMGHSRGLGAASNTDAPPVPDGRAAVRSPRLCPYPPKQFVARSDDSHNL